MAKSKNQQPDKRALGIEEELRKELEEYKKEKERVRAIVGQIGGSTNRRIESLVNVTFLLIILTIFILTYFFHIASAMVSLEIGILLVSIKIIWMMQTKAKVDHFQFWILNSIEFRINDVSKRIGDLEKKTRELYTQINAAPDQDK